MQIVHHALQAVSRSYAGPRFGLFESGRPITVTIDPYDAVESTYIDSEQAHTRLL